MEDLLNRLTRMSLDELRNLCKTLDITGYSKLRKPELIERIKQIDKSRLRRQLFPTWWQQYHNHLYGIASVVGLFASVGFFFWPSSDTGMANPLSLQASTIETPIRFSDYAQLTPKERESLFNNRVGEEFVWQGFLINTIGFDVNSIGLVPYDTPIAIEITPMRSPSPQLKAQIQFGEIEPTDGGVELVTSLDKLGLGQRIRLSGVLTGTAESPVLDNAVLEAVYPYGE